MVEIKYIPMDNMIYLPYVPSHVKGCLLHILRILEGNDLRKMIKFMNDKE